MSFALGRIKTQTETKKGLNSGFDQGKQFAISQYLIPEDEIDY